MRITALALIVVMALSYISCREEAGENFIMTVTGPVSVSEMGQSLTHEHVLVDWAGADSTGYHRWNRDSVVMRVLPFLQEIKQLGVNSFVDCSPAYLGRDPFVLRDLAEKSGLAILTNTGYYGAVDNRFIPLHAWEESAVDIAMRWIDEYENGIDGSGVKPGFIKIGVKEDGALSGLHRKLVLAAAITHKQTGLTIKSHTVGDIPAFEQIEILLQEGVAPSAFIWTHAQGGSLDKQVEAAGKGAWISLDGVNTSGSREEGDTGNLNWYVERLAELKNAGVLDRVLLSHDAGWYDAGEPNGGGFRSYTGIHLHLIPALRETGFTEGEINQLITVNPAQAFEVRVRMR